MDKQLLSHLEQHPSWAALKEHLEERKETKKRSYLKTLLVSDQPISALELGELRGYVKAINDIFKAPELATKEIERDRNRDARGV